MMEGLITKINNVTFNQSVPYEVADKKEQRTDDPAKLIPGFELKPMTFTDFLCQNREFLRTSWTVGSTTTISVTPSSGLILSELAFLLDKYRHVRFELEITVEATACWNMTGLLCLWWMPFGGTYRALYGQPSLPTNYDYAWYVPPTQKTYIRVGQDTTKTITVPWISPEAAMTGINKYTDDSEWLYNNYYLPTAYLTALVPIRSVATAEQTAPINVWFRLTNIHVGGYIG
jgi:hypothetical protein